MQGASRLCRPSLERDHHVATDERAALHGDQATCGICTLCGSAVNLKLL